MESVSSLSFLSKTEIVSSIDQEKPNFDALSTHALLHTCLVMNETLLDAHSQIIHATAYSGLSN